MARKKPNSSGSAEVSAPGCREGELYAGRSADDVRGDRDGFLADLRRTINELIRRRYS